MTSNERKSDSKYNETDSIIKSLLLDMMAETPHYTHVSMYNPTGRIDITRNKIKNVYNTYSERVNSGDDIVVGLGERPQNYSQLVVDADIKVLKDSKFNIGEIIYKKDDVKKLIKIYNNVLRKVIQDCTNEKLMSVLLERPSYAKGEKYISNGFHIHYPNLIINRVKQSVHILPRVIKEVEKAGLFKELNLQGSVIDTGAFNNPWLMYGSRRTLNSKPYKATCVYIDNGKDIQQKPLNYLKDHTKIYDRSENEIKYVKNIEYYLPRILSIIPYGRKCVEFSEKLEFVQKVEMIKADDFKNGDLDEKTMSEKMKQCAEVMPMLSPSRADDFWEWWTVGKVLYSIGEGCEEAMEMWINFSRNCAEKFDEAVCIHKWEKMNKLSYTIGTLLYYAKLDSPKEYIKYKIENRKESVEDSIMDGTNYDLATILYKEYKEEFVYVGREGTKRLWYRFVNGIWHKNTEDILIRRKISTTIFEIYKKKYLLLAAQFPEASTAEAKRIDADIKQIKKIIRSLKTTAFKNNVIKEAEELFYDQEFLEKLDKNKFIIAFNDGNVYDLKLNICRPGVPEDYLSKFLPHPRKIYKHTDPEIIAVEDYLFTLFPDKDVRKYMKDKISEVFVAGNSKKEVLVCSGENGDNGKSVFMKLIELCLGSYAIKLPTSLITGKRTQSSSACPELARAGNGVRWAVLQEPETGAVMNTGIVKELSGNDTFYARTLHKEGGEITPSFKLALICNALPHLDADEQSIWNRMRNVVFESVFCRDAPKTRAEQILQKRFPIDTDFMDKLPAMCAPFIWYLLDHRKTRMECNRPHFMPDKVVNATAAYRKYNDINAHFIEEVLIEDKKSIISLQEVYSLFKEWFKEGYPNSKLAGKLEFQHFLTKHWGPMSKSFKWKGFRVRNVQDDIDSGDVLVLEMMEQGKKNSEK